jgi:DNA polymerase III subunit alpha
MEDFVHLHVHTYYSILDGMSSVTKVVDKAIGDGMRGVAITDHGNMFGVKELFDYCKKVNGKRKDEGLPPFKPIFGCEMYVARRTKKDMDHTKGDRGGYHLVVLAKNERGYRNLVKLVSRAWVDGFYGRPRTDREDLAKFHEGLIVCSACIAGNVPKKILDGDIAGAREAIEWHKSIWGDDYYLELQRHEVKNPAQRANRETFPLQQKANAVIMELAKEYGVKLVCTNDCHFVDEDDAEAHDHLLCLSTGKDLDDPSRMLYSKQEWFKTRAEMNEVFSDVPEALANTCEILDKVETYNIDSDPIMPFFPIPEDFGNEEQWRKKFSEEDLFREFTSDENGENPLPRDKGEEKIKKLGGYDKIYRIKLEADYLRKLAYDGAARLYGNPLSQEVDDRIRFELHVMKTMGFPGYFLIVQDFINSARKELGVWVGPGRGSAAGSVVAYCLGITKIDPLKYDLLFERFLNPDRISLPDIDTDFDDDGRGKVLRWVMDKYGHENCAHIITYSTMATKNSLKDVARVEKVPLDQVNALCKAIPDRLSLDGKDLKMNLGNAIKCVKELQDAERSDDPRMADTIKYARKLEGTVRGTGIHACGFIICRDPISDHVPVSTADDPDFPGVKTAVTQYDGHVIESTGLIKMDFLGLKTLSEQKEAVKIIKRTRGIDLDLDNIPIDDPATYRLYQEGRTVGTFQFESQGMRAYLRKLHPTVFEDLIAMNALYRPGPMDYIPSFIARKNGSEEITYDIPVMEKYLKDTYGITVYQEQVMLLSRLLAGFTRGESDKLRKAMGKKQKKIVDEMKPKFIEGGKKNGYDPAVLGKIWGDWEKFASYAFNKSHAACYSWVAYQTAYLKANYPAEFMAAIMTRRKDDIKEITKLMDECRTMNITTLGPDVNESFAEFGVNKKGEIRFGLAAVKGMGEAPANAIIEEREKNGPYKDIYDFAERINYSSVNRRCFESLVYSGAFDSFGLQREQYVNANDKGEVFLDQLVKYGNTVQNDKMNIMGSLFGDDEAASISKPAPAPSRSSGSSLDMLNKEKSLIGIYLSAHPLDNYKVVLKRCVNAKCQEMTSDNITSLIRRGTQWSFGGMVTNVMERYTKRNTLFAKVKIEDFDGEGELTIFDQWSDVRNKFVVGCAVYVRVNLETPRWNPSRVNMRIESVGYLADAAAKLIKKMRVSLSADIFCPVFNKMLTDQVENHPGNTTVVLSVMEPKTRTPVELQLKHGVQPTMELIEGLESYEGVKVTIEGE